MEKENIYIDLSKCSEEEQKYTEIKCRKSRPIKCFGIANLYEKYTHNHYIQLK